MANQSQILMRRKKMLKSVLFTFAISALILSGCDSTNNKNFIGSAIVDAQIFQIATTAQGQIIALNKEEGQAVSCGELVAVIDTIPLVLRYNEICAMAAELTRAISSKKIEISSQESDVKGVDREYKRMSAMVADGVAPTQQKDNLETQAESSKLRVDANKGTLAGLVAKINTLEAQKAQLRDQIARCYVRAAAGGVVLTKYKNNGEIVLPGSPIFEIGRYDTMQIDFYVPQAMLSGFTLGQNVRVRLDVDGKEKQLFCPAKISWISSDAEFSPKNIQTRESRNELVFKIRALAPNANGILKRGLPVEIWK